MHIDAAIEDLVIPLADFLQKLIARLHPAAGPGQAEQQIIFDRSQREHAAAEKGAAGRRYDPKFSDHNIVVGHGLDHRRAISPARDRAQTRQKFPGGKSLGQIIVRADLQTHDPVGLLAARGQHQHRHAGGSANPPQNFQPVDAGKHDIEKDRVPRTGRSLPYPVKAVVDRDHVVTERLEVIDQEAAELFVVVHQQDAARAGRLICRGCI